MDTDNSIRTAKVMILGDSGVGKSSILAKYVHNTFQESYNATLGFDFITIDKIIDGHPLRLQLWDTVGQERYRSLGALYYRGADACIFVFDLTNNDSFKNLDEWIKFFFSQLPEQKVDNFPVLLLGNKADITPHVISETEILNWSDKNKNIKYVEVSAKTGQGIEDSFSHIVNMADKVIKIDE